MAQLQNIFVNPRKLTTSTNPGSPRGPKPWRCGVPVLGDGCAWFWMVVVLEKIFTVLFFPLPPPQNFFLPEADFSELW